MDPIPEGAAIWRQFTANQILSCSTPFEAKCLGYQINGFDVHRWKQDGYDLCLDSIKEKFLQNPPLLRMLKTTAPKKIVEACLDKQWGTGIQLCDANMLRTKKWHGDGWMSTMLDTIRNLDIPNTN